MSFNHSTLKKGCLCLPRINCNPLLHGNADNSIPYIQSQTCGPQKTILDFIPTVSSNQESKGKITVVVGKEQVKFKLNSSQASAHSSRFLIQGQGKTLHLPDVDPDTFHFIAVFITSQCQSLNDEDTIPHVIDLVKIYNLATDLQMPHLNNLITEILRDHIIARKLLLAIVSGMVTDTDLPVGSTLRKLVVDNFALEMLAREINNGEESDVLRLGGSRLVSSYSPFAAEIQASYLRARISLAKWNRATSQPCHYHEHRW